ncbi:threonine aldolase family protein [Mesobacterium pallidum]|uniref:threonine aldolase family protein n=1 Tax=Mesobacterium pallidum TaxID=2872037 RepID=UPI001EE1E0C0|nr:beta-eliminating lyase-related protein [Mesobacterium pallidum]
MFFASDNSGPVPSQIMEALAEANTGHAMAYGNDGWMSDLRTRLREVFEAPEADVQLVATGTAANSLALATLSEPWQGIYCSPVAHIFEDECNAPEFFTAGARLVPVGTTDRIPAEALRRVMAETQEGFVHMHQRGPVSITQVTEQGTVYTLEEIRAICGVAKSFEQPVHMDGARFANALVALDCTPAEMTWRAGVDALSFGGTKNGCLGVEAVLFFDPKHAWEFELRRKRSGHLLSKHRYLSAQLLGYLKNDLWLDTARAANAAAARLAEGLRKHNEIEILYDVDANMIFFTAPRRLHARLKRAGAVYGITDGSPVDSGDPDARLRARLVCDWSIGSEGVDAFLSLL